MRNKMKKTKALILSLLLLFSCFGAVKSPFLTLQNLKTLQKQSSFTSKDELLQLFCTMYHQSSHTEFLLQGDELKESAKEFSTLFPIKKATKIALKNDTLSITFPKRQRVVVPNTMRQAKLHLSPLIKFRVSKDIQSYHNETVESVRFSLIEGDVNLSVSTLGQIFSGLPNIEGTDLFYTQDQTQKVSKLELVHLMHFTEKDLIIKENTPEKRVIDVIKAPYFTKYEGEFRLTPQKISIFNTDLELKEFPTFLMNGKEVKDEKIYKTIKDVSSIFSIGTTAEMAQLMEAKVSAFHNMESKKSGLTMNIYKREEK